MVKKIIKKTLGGLVEPKLNALKFGLAGGITMAIYVFLITLTGLFGWFGGLTGWTSLIADIYGSLGYKVSFIGAILGAIYSFVDGFILTYIFAWIYNKIL